jgi:ribosomal protein S18 acetylase RimI-like enzyme
MITAALPEDGAPIHKIDESTSIFSRVEVETVDEMWSDYLTQGPEKSGYYFVVWKEAGNVLGYACYGPRALTDQTYDLYWIAVDPNARGGGIGKKLLAGTEEAVHNQGGRLLVVETSGLPEYESTRAFYRATHYLEEAILKDFYKDGDDLFIYTKKLK